MESGLKRVQVVLADEGRGIGSEKNWLHLVVFTLLLSECKWTESEGWERVENNSIGALPAKDDALSSWILHVSQSPCQWSPLNWHQPTWRWPICQISWFSYKSKISVQMTKSGHDNLAIQHFHFQLVHYTPEIELVEIEFIKVRSFSPRITLWNIIMGM